MEGLIKVFLGSPFDEFVSSKIPTLEGFGNLHAIAFETTNSTKIGDDVQRELVFEGDDLRGKFVQLVGMAQGIAEQNTKYDLLNNNSNTLADTILKWIGAKAPQLDNYLAAPGSVPDSEFNPQLFENLPPPLWGEELYDEFREVFEKLFDNIKDYCFAAGTKIRMADGSLRPIELVSINDEVLAYDNNDQHGQGRLAARRVTRTYSTPDKLVIDFHGLKVTPGHVFLCGDGPHVGQHHMLMEILRADGTIVHADGTVLRAATNAPVGSREDAFVQVAYLTDANDALMQTGQMRAGTLILTAEGETKSVLQCMEEEGYRFDAESGLIAKEGEEPHPLYWFGEVPRPEDYILKRSDLTDADLYAEPDYQPEVAAATTRLGQGITPAEGTLHAEAAIRAGETIH
ncbi:Hint domain-containing protein [Denitrobaculum tricleocarpae]|uniref:Hint domain-containing protein n=1 Tax=Denitrobaculum tricleocarpae TaxID=2591009 RepID=A0A545TP92_9PROT|nr:Hint domain-containing protein [Denitrobaculum tricleocarpae]TQV79037.1 hypothetical protein FKG95_15245 [Denitrobaculum tricleocarpae]